MFKLISKLLWNIWSLHFTLAKRLRLGNSQEELVISSIFLTTLLFSIYFASTLFFLRIETRYSLDIKILSLFFFMLTSTIQIIYLFGKAKRYQQIKEIINSLLTFTLFFLIWFLTLILLGVSMLFQYFDGSIEKFIKYISSYERI
ncbi:MAG: hypothetical protein ACK42Z_07050 [Candidatus Kapaibacteriota bacterium]